MQVLDFAMQMEIDGKEYYEKLAGQTDVPGLKTIFLRLAEDEQKHYETFEKWKASGKVPAMPETTILADVRNVFETLPKSDLLQGKKANLAAYQQAMKIEADSFRLYEDAAEKEQDRAMKKLLLQVAAEEHNHFNILENVYHFINAPNQYLAWGEFSNLDEFRQFGRDVDS